jgi:hypothetical protein
MEPLVKQTMDPTVVAAVVIALFAIIVVATYLVFRQRAKVNIKGPMGTELSVDASNEPTPQPPGIDVEDATARQGGLMAEDETGRGVRARRVDTQDDIILASRGPGPESQEKKEDSPT